MPPVLILSVWLTAAVIMFGDNTEAATALTLSYWSKTLRRPQMNTA